MTLSDRERPVLVVEDEAPIRDGIEELLRGQGFDVTAAADGTTALAALASTTFAVVVLDLMIPSPTGLDVLRSLRLRDSATPVLVLTALGAEDDIVRGLEAGADDYVTKPFGVRELVARVRGLARRPRAEPSCTTRYGEIEIDHVTNEMRRGTRLTRLSAREAALFTYLAVRAGETVSREQLLVDVWGYRTGEALTRTVDVHVQQLRSKLRAIASPTELIETVRGQGYRYVGGAPE